MPQLTYMTKRGAGIVVAVQTAEDCEAKMNRLRCPATLMDGAEKAGEVWRCHGECDGPCNGWHWSFDPDVFRK